ncbi:BgtA-21116 [Blumeria graminis f. sp. tritici]|uniref:BgtA-21116 n=2 Tax=Blumeria graminis f. sp. tritici TaxID=62690 RepID=A0A9X9L8Z5_BLUGR|nr:hypothetical protein BGT96224_A21116 [Blumeria graminis f. sp. tritici 96224]VCU39997.1 BgtA-21116 [Blumeria graminis f. sp. tritici]
MYENPNWQQFVADLNFRSNRRNNRQIRGPHSALTDFLASHNISANQIKEDAIARKAAILAAQQIENENGASSSSQLPSEAPLNKGSGKVHGKKRKLELEKAISSAKASQLLKRSRTLGMDKDSTECNDQNEEYVSEDKLATVGKITNCEICEKRFTITVHNLVDNTSNDKSLLCPTCIKNSEHADTAMEKRNKQRAGATRRKNASNILDGIYPGAKNLATLCVETLANNVHEAESFGNLPLELVKKLGAILSKRRLITSPILDLFLEQKHDSLTITDGAKLCSEDYIRIFQLVPSIKHLKLRNAIHFKNVVIDHLLGTTVNLESLDIHGANLIDDERWERFLTEKSAQLRNLKVHFTDNHFGDSVIDLLPKCCPQLERLKVSHNSKVSNEGLVNIGLLENLQYLSIELYRPVGTKSLTSTPLIKLLNSIGSKLRTFSLETVPQVDNRLLQAIHENCRHLTKLRITGSQSFTDSGFASLFTNWSNAPLNFLDFSECRHVDAVEPSRNTDKIGLCSSGFQAIMSHSGSKLKHLDISSCRHISLDTFEEIFATDKVYPALEHFDVSFCQAVNDYVVGCIFRSCPSLKVLTVFGCFGVRSIKIPKGKILTGTPNAIGMQIEGTEDGEGRVV